jgi:hypothetical protein
MSENSNGADDGVCGDRDVGGLLENMVEGEANGVGAALVKADSVSVPIEGALVDLIMAGDARNAMPIEKLAFD